MKTNRSNVTIKQESKGLKHFNHSKAFIEYSNDVNDIYKNIEEHNPNKKVVKLQLFFMI